MQSDATVRQEEEGAGLNFRLTFYKLLFITQASVVMNNHFQYWVESV